MDLDFVSFRRILGCGQQQFADFLGTQKSVLSMAELNQRPLPSDAWLHFIQLRDCAAKFNDASEIEIPALVQNQSDSLNWSNHRILELQTELNELNAQFQQVNQEFSEAMFTLKFLRQFETEHSDRLTELQLNLIAIWKSKNLLRLIKHGPDAQKKLGARRASLVGELNFLVESTN